MEAYKIKCPRVRRTEVSYPLGCRNQEEHAACTVILGQDFFGRDSQKGNVSKVTEERKDV